MAGQARDEDASSVGVGDGRLDGRTINLTVTGTDGTVREYRGEVEGDRMSGKTADGTEWTAERIEGGGAVAEEEQDSSQTGAGSGN